MAAWCQYALLCFLEVHAAQGVLGNPEIILYFTDCWDAEGCGCRNGQNLGHQDQNQYSENYQRVYTQPLSLFFHSEVCCLPGFAFLYMPRGVPNSVSLNSTLRKQTVKDIVKLVSPGKHHQRTSLQLQSVIHKHVLEIPALEMTLESLRGLRSRTLNIV